jgi:hypothetical protein
MKTRKVSSVALAFSALDFSGAHADDPTRCRQRHRASLQARRRRGPTAATVLAWPE